MITYKDKNELYDYFAYILFFGFKHQYSFEYIETRLADSQIIKSIEKKSDISFLFNSTLSESIRNIYELKQLFDNDITDTNEYALWISEAYLRLLFKYRKSLSYLFLYISLEEMLQLFNPYHEMDWSHLYEEFERRERLTSLLRRILDKNNISINKLSQFTGISKNTLTTYLSDARLKVASFENVYKISSALNLDIDVFANHINAYVEEEMNIDFSKNNTLFSSIALFMVSYFSSDISNRKYEYDEKEEIYKYKDLKLKVLLTSFSSNQLEKNTLNEEANSLLDEYSQTINKEERNKHVVIIYESNQISTSLSPYKDWLKYGFEKIFIFNSNNIICIKDDYWKSNINASVLENIKNRAITNN